MGSCETFARPSENACVIGCIVKQGPFMPIKILFPILFLSSNLQVNIKMI